MPLFAQDTLYFCFPYIIINSALCHFQFDETHTFAITTTQMTSTKQNGRLSLTQVAMD